jgi:hypothetical protein
VANATSAARTSVAAVDAGLDLSAGADLARASLALARRFAAGATLWCLAPEWPDHGRHVAVEFVHPVIMGKRALPAVSLNATDPIVALRTASRPGDVLVIIAPAGSAVAGEAAWRSPAWGLTTVWIGSGDRAPVGRADHVVWVDDPRGTARHDGRLVLRYHVLWELTHVCFEHPGLLVDHGCDDDATCITCSDEGRPAEVATVLEDGLVSVRTARGVETIDATLIGEVAAGDLVLVHAGTAIERLEPTDG